MVEKNTPIDSEARAKAEEAGEEGIWLSICPLCSIGTLDVEKHIREEHPEVETVSFRPVQVWADIKRFAKRHGWGVEVQQRAWTLFEEEGGVAAYKALYGASSAEGKTHNAEECPYCMRGDDAEVV